MIKILTSVMGLGTYVPALFLMDYLNGRGVPCELELIESHLGNDKIEKFLKNKEQYHNNFKAAKLGHKLAEKQLSSLLQGEEKWGIFKEWDRCSCQSFVVMSGNWMEIMLEYTQRKAADSHEVYTIHMDVGATPSWCRFMDMPGFHNIEIFHKTGIRHIFEYPKKFYKEQAMFEERGNGHIYIHGGGWGMGTYQSRYQDFKKLPYNIRTTIHQPEEADFTTGWEYYLLDSSWMPWNSERETQYPPLSRVRNGNIESISNHMHSGMYSLYETCCAIISKAGGGSLMDSMITATPLIFIEPIAKHEQENQDLWISLGFGITYEAWELMDYSIELLHDIYRNLIRAREQISGVGADLLNAMKENVR